MNVRVMQTGEILSPNTLIAIDARADLPSAPRSVSSWLFGGPGEVTAFPALGRQAGSEDFGAIRRYGILLDRRMLGSEIASIVAGVVGSTRFALGVYLDDDGDTIVFTTDALGRGAQAAGAALGQNVAAVGSAAANVANAALEGVGAPNLQEVWSTAKLLGLAIFVLIVVFLGRGGSVKAGSFGVSG